MIVAVRPGEFDLVGGTCRADGDGAEMLGPLACDQADAAGRRVEEDRVARFHLVGAAQQVFGRHALQHHGRRLLVGNGVGYLHQAVGRNDAPLGIGTGADRISDAVARLQADHALTHFFHDACALAAGDQRQAARCRIETGAIINVDEIEADGGVTDENLPRPRPAGVRVFPDHHLGAAVGMDADRFRHGQASFAPSFGNNCNTPPMQKR